jgi:hypothetical protein
MQQTRPLGGPLYTAEHRTAAVHAEAHTFFRTACPTGCDSANRRTAQLLITPVNFLAAARHDHRIEVIAAALWVTPDLVETYIRALPVEDWLRMRQLVGHDPY